MLPVSLNCQFWISPSVFSNGFSELSILDCPFGILQPLLSTIRSKANDHKSRGRRLIAILLEKEKWVIYVQLKTSSVSWNYTRIPDEITHPLPM